MREASFLKYWPRSLGESSDQAGNAALAAATAALVSLSLASWTMPESGCLVTLHDRNEDSEHTFSYNLVS